MGLVRDPQGTQNTEPQRKQGQKLPTSYVPSKTLGGKGSKPAKISLAFLLFLEAGYSLAGVPSSFPSKHSKERGNKSLLPCITNRWETVAGSSPPRASPGAQSPRGAPGGVLWPSRVPARRQEVGTHRRGTGSHSSPHRRALQSTPAPAPAGAAGARGRAGYCGADKGPLLRDLCSGTGRGRWGAQLCLPLRSERWVSSQPPPLSPATGTPPPHGASPVPELIRTHLPPGRCPELGTVFPGGLSAPQAPSHQFRTGLAQDGRCQGRRGPRFTQAEHQQPPYGHTGAGRAAGAAPSPMHPSRPPQTRSSRHCAGAAPRTQSASLLGWPSCRQHALLRAQLGPAAS